MTNQISESFILSMIADATEDTIKSRRNEWDLALEYASSAVLKAEYAVELLDQANAGENHIVLVDRARMVRDRAHLAMMEAEIRQADNEGWSDLERTFFSLGGLY